MSDINDWDAIYPIKAIADGRYTLQPVDMDVDMDQQNAMVFYGMHGDNLLFCIEEPKGDEGVYRFVYYEIHGKLIRIEVKEINTGEVKVND